MFIQILAVVGTVIGFIAVTLAVAAGLYYMSEIIEDNIEFTKRTLQRSIQVICVWLILMVIFDGFPWKLTIFSLLSYYIYSLNLKQFPNVNLTGPVFVLTCILALSNHYLWFRYFSNPYIPPLEERLAPGFKMPHYPTFTEIASFFGICVWFVPFALFISVSSNDSALPLTSTDLNKDTKEDLKVKKSVNLVRYALSSFAEKIDSLLAKMGVGFRLQRRDSSNPNKIYA